MESLSAAAAAASGWLPCFSGAGIDSRRANPIGGIGFCSGKDREGYARSGVSRGVLRSEFGDDGHVKYYGGKLGFDLNKDWRKEGGKAEIKKKLKMSKGLTEEEGFSEFSWMERRGGGGGGGEVIEGQEKPISEAAEVLLKQLEQLKAEEKELKRKIKEQKAKLKAERKKVMVDSESSSSSESSDSECGEVTDMGRLRTEVLLKEEGNNAGTLALPNGVLYREATASMGRLSTEVLSKEEGNNAGTLGLPNGVLYREATATSPSDFVAGGAVTKRIEVCMGKKCKTSGGPALLEEFKNVVGVEGAVVECKCLGKCRDGPNVRVSNSLGENQAPEADDSVRIPANPLLIGVGLEDVDALVAKYLVKDGDLGLNAA